MKPRDKLGSALEAAKSMAPCFGCGRNFSFSQMHVPSIIVNSRREPLCHACERKRNPMRKPRDKLAGTLEAARALVRMPPAPPPAAADELTAERIERAMVLLAFAITATGEKKFAPLLDYLEREVTAYRNTPDPIERARAILERHTESLDGTGKAIR